MNRSYTKWLVVATVTAITILWVKLYAVGPPPGEGMNIITSFIVMLILALVALRSRR